MFSVLFFLSSPMDSTIYSNPLMNLLLQKPYPKFSGLHMVNLWVYSVCHCHLLAWFMFTAITPLSMSSIEKFLFLGLKLSYHLTPPHGNNFISQGSSLCSIPAMLFCPLAFCSGWFPYPLAKLQTSPNIPFPFIAISPVTFIISTPYSTLSYFLVFKPLLFSQKNYLLLRGRFWIFYSFCLTVFSA